MLSHIRDLIKQADPDVVEEWKWSVPVWSHDGLICTGEAYKSVVKLTFALTRLPYPKSARPAWIPESTIAIVGVFQDEMALRPLKDPSGLFNSSLEGTTRRAIDFHKGDEIDADAFKTLIRTAAALNRSSGR